MNDKVKQNAAKSKAVDYTTMPQEELVALLTSGKASPEVGAEILRRFELAKAETAAAQAAQKAAEEKAVRAAKAPRVRVEKTTKEKAADNAAFRIGKLVQQFGIEAVDLKLIVLSTVYLNGGISKGVAPGNLRQTLNRIQQYIKANETTEVLFPEDFLETAFNLPDLDENLKVEEQAEILEKYIQAAEETEAGTEAE